MQRIEVAELLSEIEVLYPGRVKVDDPKARFETFATILATEKPEKIHQNLIAHAKSSVRPPTVHDLLKGADKEARPAVPDLAETEERLRLLETHRPIRDKHGFITGYEENRPPTEEELKEIEGYKAEIRRTLGIGGTDHESGK